MAEEKKKGQQLDEDIDKLRSEYINRQSDAPSVAVQPFSYDAESDKGYQEYVRLMQDNGKRAMEDTVGKASALTGGYGNSYAAAVGQQVYDDYAKQAADAKATYRQMAREDWDTERLAKEVERANFDAQNQDILNRLAMMKEQKSDLWSKAALKASYGDYSGYVDDLGVYGSIDEAKAAFATVREPTEAEIEYAKKLYVTYGELAYDGYLNQLQGVNTDAIREIIDTDEELIANAFMAQFDPGRLIKEQQNMLRQKALAELEK